MMAHLPVWRCIMYKAGVCEYGKCTCRTHEKPSTCLHPEHGIKAIWERYEGRTGQRHFDGGL